MNKKILLGSIIAVVILVMVSFTGVVGYQTNKSSTITKVSPLFSMRSRRAIDEETEDFNCDYVGKGKSTFFTIPKRTNKIEAVQKITEIISKTNYKTFKVYLNLIINQLQNNVEFDDVNINKVIAVIHQLRSHPERIIVDYDNNNGRFTTDEKYLICLFFHAVRWLIVLSILLIITGITGALTIAFCPTFPSDICY